jgi:hypothetical protein
VPERHTWSAVLKRSNHCLQWLIMDWHGRYKARRDGHEMTGSESKSERNGPQPSKHRHTYRKSRRLGGPLICCRSRYEGFRKSYAAFIANYKYTISPPTQPSIHFPSLHPIIKELPITTTYTTQHGANKHQKQSSADHERRSWEYPPPVRERKRKTVTPSRQPSSSHP